MEAALRADTRDEADRGGAQAPGEGYYRGGFQLREWGERHGPMVPSKPIFTSSFGNNMPAEHKWDVKASHEHMRLRMQVSRATFSTHKACK